MTEKNIKICLLSSVPGTLLAFYRDMIKQLINNGFEVTLISSDFPELHQMKDDLGCKIFPVTISRKISPLRDFISICKLRRYLRKEKFDIIHAHTPKGGLIGMISSWLGHIPNRVYTIHGLPMETAHGLTRRLLWFAERISCKLATKILAVSHSLMERVIDEKICKKENIKVLGSGSACGIDLDKFSCNREISEEGKSIRKQLGIENSTIIIGFVGRIVTDKGVNTLVDSFLHLRQRREDVRLMLLGRFDEARDTLPAKTTQAIKNNKNIDLIGYKKNPAPFYAAMDILTLPSRREGFGLTLIEAAAMELPTIATKVTGCVNAIEDGFTGILVAADDSEQLYQAMLNLTENPELRKKLGKQGRQRVEKLFNSKVLIDKHINLYKSLL